MNLSFTASYSLKFFHSQSGVQSLTRWGYQQLNTELQISLQKSDSPLHNIWVQATPSRDTGRETLGQRGERERESPKKGGGEGSRRGEIEARWAQ